MLTRTYLVIFLLLYLLAATHAEQPWPRNAKLKKLSYTNPDSAVLLLDEKRSYFNQKNLQDSVQKTYFDQLSLLVFYNKFDKAESILDALNPNDFSPMDSIKFHFHKGKIYSYQGSPKAIFHGEKALELCSRLKDQTDYIATASNLALYYRNTGEFLLAAEYLIMALEQTENNFLKAEISKNIASLYTSLHQFQRAKEYLSQALAIYDENGYTASKEELAFQEIRIQALQDFSQVSPQDIEAFLPIFLKDKIRGRSNLCNTHMLLAEVYEARENLGKTQEHLKLAKELANRLKDNYRSQQILHSEAKLMLAQNETEKALSILKVALKNEKETKSIMYSKLLFLRSEVYEQSGLLKEALDDFEQAGRTEEQVFRNREAKRLHILEAKYHRKKQQQAIQDLGEQSKIQAQTLGIQKNNLWLLGGLSSILFLLGFWTFFKYKKSKEQRALIAENLVEKDMLLKEIHHRVKNNLQLISGLLGLQSRDVSDPKAVEALHSGQNRVRSMALIHQDLYNNEELLAVNVKEYIGKLANGLFEAHENELSNVALELDVESVELDVDILVPLGLVVNELLTNTIKYAFPQQQSGKVKVHVQSKGDTLFVQVSDNGIGIPEAKNRSRSFGMTLIHSLTQQLNGDFSLKNEEGTTAQLVIPSYKSAV